MMMYRPASKVGGINVRQLAKRYFGPLQSEEPYVTPNYVCLSAAVFPKGECSTLSRDAPSIRL